MFRMPLLCDEFSPPILFHSGILRIPLRQSQSFLSTAPVNLVKDLGNSLFPTLYFLTFATEKKKKLQPFCLSTRGTDSIHQGPLKGQWQVSFSCLENVMWILSATFQLGNKSLCSRTKTVATKYASPPQPTQLLLTYKEVDLPKQY